MTLRRANEVARVIIPTLVVALALLALSFASLPAGAQDGTPAGTGGAELQPAPSVPGVPATRMPAIPEDARVDAPRGPTADAPDIRSRPGAGSGGASESGAAPSPAAPPVTAPAGTPPPAEANAEATSPAPSTGVAEDARALIGILRDDAARARLIEELERIGAGSSEAGADAGATTAAGEASSGPRSRPRVGPASDAEGDARPETLGERIAEISKAAIDEVLNEAETIWNGLNTTLRRLGGFQRLDTDEALGIAIEIAAVAAAAIGAIIILRWIGAGLSRAIAARANPQKLIRNTLLAGAVIVVDAIMVLIAFVVGIFVAVLAMPPIGDITIFQTLFLQAFALSELMIVGVRALLRPRVSAIRPLPMSDATARYWSSRLAAIVRVLTYGQMFVQPLVIETTSIFTGRATVVLIFVAVLVWAMTLVVRHRKEPAAYFHKRASEQGNDVTLNFMAWAFGYWHLLLLPYFAVLFVSAITSGGAVKPVLIATAQILGGFAAGAFLVAWITRVTARGIRLPASVNERLPMLERRLDSFVPAFLRLLRFVIFIVWVSYSLHVVNVLDFWEWTESNFRIDIAGTLAGLTMIVLGGFVVWLALNSWIDYRLMPRRGRRVTSREQTLLTLLRNAASIAIWVITLMFGLSEIGIDIAPLLASAGVLGLAIGFGAQRMVQDIITGIFIQFENAINVGDVVTVGGTTGVVEKLTIRSVSLRDVEGVFHIIPFSSVDMVSNFMRGFSYHVADMGIAYREDIDETKAQMLAAFDDLKANPELNAKIIGDLEWFGVQSLADSAVVLRARIKTRPGDQWGVGRAYNEACKKRFDSAGIEIPFPQTTVWFGEGKDGSAPAAPIVLAERAAAKRLIEEVAKTPEKTEDGEPGGDGEGAPSGSKARGPSKSAPDAPA